MPKKYYRNLTNTQKQALTELARDETLVIKQADKGSGIVVEDRTNYVRDGLAHLSNDKVYEKLDTDPTKPLARAINQFVTEANKIGCIDDITKKYLLFQEAEMPRTQQMYFLKKIHKGPTEVRPICSGCGGPTERLSAVVDKVLQPFVPRIKSYIKDTGHFIRIIEETTLPKDCILATIDVKSMYTNIPHEEGIKAVIDTLYKSNPNAEYMPIPAQTLADMLNIVLTKNYFQFDNSMYHQIQGTAMGTKMAPAYANLFMAKVEELMLETYPTKPELWKRFIDDIFMVWLGSPESLNEFVSHLNQAHPTIKFTCQHSACSVDFLDVTLYKGDRFASTGKLDIKPFFKPTNKFQYLHYQSAHPRNTFRSLVKGELTRLLRACSDAGQYKSIQLKMLAAFRDRGYPARLVKNVIGEVPFSNRESILNKDSQDQCPFDTFLVVKYTPDLDITKVRSALRPDEEEPVPKPCLSLKKSRSIKQSIVRAKLKGAPDLPESKDAMIIKRTPILEGRSAGCGTAGCKCCKAMSGKQRVFHQTSGEPFSTPRHSNCNTNNVIYLLECRKCESRNQYVGQTSRPLSQRVAGHRMAAKTKPNLPLYKHFSRSNHDFERDAQFSILEKTRGDWLLQRESHWISTLETVYPKGLNSRFDKTDTSGRQDSQATPG